MSGRRWTAAEDAELARTYPLGKWPEILASVPGRDRSSCRNRVAMLGLRRKNSRTPWTGADVVLVRKLWPKATRADIEAAIPRHTYGSISKKAGELKLRRDKARKQSRYRLMRELREARRLQNITQATVAYFVGTQPVQIAKWERGETVPRFASFLDWVEAMGFRIELRRAA